MASNYHLSRWYNNLSMEEKVTLEALRKAQSAQKEKDTSHEPLNHDVKFVPRYWDEDEIPKFDEPEESSKIRQTLKFSMHNSLIKLLTVNTFQLFFCFAIAYTETENLSSNLDKVPPVSQSFCQFIAGMLMQMNINYEAAQGMMMMKYALNHQWKFKHPHIAFMAGFFQATSTVLTAFVCYTVIISSKNILDLAKDFTALMFIIEIDNFFAATSHDSIAKEIIEKQGTNRKLKNKPIMVKVDDLDLYTGLFRVETTTSKNALDTGNVPLEERDDEAN